MTSALLVLAALLLTGTAVRTMLHDHQTDRALMPWAWVQLGGSAICVYAGFATAPF